MLLLYFDGHGTSFDAVGRSYDRIKRRKLPKGYKYLDERTKEEEVSRPKEPKVSEAKETLLVRKPVSLEDVQKLAKVFQGDLYPESLHALVDILNQGIAPSGVELENALYEAQLYQQIAEAQREKELLNQLHNWLLAQIKQIAWTEDEIVTVLLIAMKK